MKLLPDIENVYLVRHQYSSAWTSPSIVRARDMADFGPPVQTLEPRARHPPDPGVPKPVHYLPVPRRGGKELFPAVSLHVGLVEEGGFRNVQVPAWEGAEVQLEVVNLWDPGAPRSIQLGGVLEKLVCTVDISPDTVRTWLDRSGPLGAAVNENLLEFRFRIPIIDEGGQVFSGESHERLFLYRRKVLVFYPGVFGSQVQFETPEGQKIGFPDLYVEDRPPSGPYASAQAMSQLGSALGAVTLPVQKIGSLECDEAGEPLMEPLPPKLFVACVPGLGPKVYDIFGCLHAASRRRHTILPDGFLLYQLRAAPYDWRKDLTRTAQDKLEELKILCEGHSVGLAPDTDDQVAVVGHSTGGLIVRRMLVEPEADRLVSHAFFQNVPFRGAAKTLSVIATGRDPLDGDTMIPGVDPRSLRAVALTAPIVYHLSPSPHHADDAEPVFQLDQGQGPDPMYGLAGEAAWVKLAIEKGFMPSRKVLPAGLGAEQRKQLALRADDWNAYWEKRWEHQRGRALLGWKEDHWPARELAGRGLAAQDALRVERGWSAELAGAAARFHATCEKWAKEGAWADRCFIFYSVAKDATTLRHDARLLAREEHDLMGFLEACRIPVRRLDSEELAPPRETVEGDIKKEHGLLRLKEKSVWVFEHWQQASEGRYVRERWRVASLRQIHGDGTVPLPSLIGFGGKAKVFRRLVTDDNGDGSGPDHLTATKHPDVWDRIVDVLHGVDVTKHLAPLTGPEKVDPVPGTDDDPRLVKLREEYART